MGMIYHSINPGNEGLVIGNFGEKARKLFDARKNSEGHYLELLHKIGIDDKLKQKLCLMQMSSYIL